MDKFIRSWRTGAALLGLMVALLTTSRAQAQVSAYSFAATSGTFTPLPATATQVTNILADDQISAALPIGFNFVFDGTTYTTVKASSNGFLSFNGSAGNNLTNSLATGAATEKPLVAPLWDDLDGRPTDATAAASYLTTGTAGSRVFTFEWLNYEWYYTANVTVISMQVKLYEGTNRIEFVYRPEANAPAGGMSASIGIAGGGTAGCASDFLSLNSSQPTATASSTSETSSINTRPVNGQVFAFTPPPPTSTGCNPVRCANVSDITGVSAVLNFNGTSNATSYTVTYQAAGGPVQTVTPAPTVAPVTLAGLALNTTYTATITANCASGASTPVTLTFTTSNGYCVTGTSGTTLGGVCGGNDITSVSLTGTTLNATGLTCSSPVSGTAYTNYPAVTPTTGTLLRGSSYPINVVTSGNSIISAWIDLNHDYAYSADEWVQVATTTTAGSVATATFLVPDPAVTPGASAYTGPTGMRIRSRATGNTNGAANACTQFFSGETKDFTVTIAPAPACPAPTNLGASAITATTATLTYTAPGTGTYTLVYGLQGFNPSVAGAGVTVSPATTSTNVTSLQAGTTYQFYVVRDCGAAGLSAYSGPFNFTTAILNDDPCGATVLPMNLNGCSPYATTSIGATTTTPNGYSNPTSGCGIGSSPRDVWFRFTTNASGSGSTDARIAVTGGPASVVQVLSATSCNGPFTVVSCTGTGANVAAPNLDLTSLQPSTTYYVRVYGYTPGSTLGNFTICVTPLPSCPTPTNASTTSITKNSATLTWTNGSVASGSTYTITYGLSGFNPDLTGTVIPGVTGTSYLLTGLTPNTNYCYYLQLNCGGLNGNSSRIGPICFQTRLESPANDDPCGAVALLSGAAATAGSNIGASTSLPGLITTPAPCAPTANPLDVWYSVTTPAAAAGTDSLILSLTGTASGLVRIYTAADCSNGPFSLVRCFGATGSNVGFPNTINTGGLLPGNTYYIAVSGYGASDAPGNFTIGAQVIYVGPPCNPVTALSTSTITTTSASISFTPGAGNTSYTVTYGPTGGASTTITVTASPVSLSSLLPSTPYTVSVTPACANGGAATGSTTTFTTLTPPCDPVTAAAAGSITSTSASISFTPGIGNTSFTVAYNAPNSPTTVVTTTASPVSLTGLMPNTVYTVTITPVCSAGGTASPTTFTFTTAMPPCDPITNLQTSNLGYDFVDLTFTPGAGNTSYSVTYSAVGVPATTLTAMGSPISLQNLLPNTTYTVSVTPVCAAGSTASAVTITFTTAPLPCDPITGLTATSTSPTSGSLTFTAGTGNTGFSVTFSAPGVPSRTITGSASPISLTSLVPNTTYTVTLTPTCAGGATATPATTTLTTPLSTRAALGTGTLSIYPNPTRGSFVLGVPAVANAHSAGVLIVNALGQVVIQKSIVLNTNGTTATVDIATLASGVYLVQVNANGQTAMARLIVE